MRNIPDRCPIGFRDTALASQSMPEVRATQPVSTNSSQPDRSVYYHRIHRVRWENPNRIIFSTPTVTVRGTSAAEGEISYGVENTPIDFEGFGLTNQITKAGLVGLVRIGILHSPHDLEKILKASAIEHSGARETASDVIRAATASTQFFRRFEITTMFHTQLFSSIYGPFRQLSHHGILPILDDLSQKPNREEAGQFLETLIDVIQANRLAIVGQVTSGFLNGKSREEVANELTPQIAANLRRLATIYSRVYGEPVNINEQGIRSVVMDNSPYTQLSDLQAAGFDVRSICLGKRRGTEVVTEPVSDTIIKRHLELLDIANSERAHREADAGAFAIKLKSGDTITVHRNDTCPFFLLAYQARTAQ